eukprot:GSMAST32.ASY1.ANO1.204.1 assembled CDS
MKVALCQPKRRLHSTIEDSISDLVGFAKRAHAQSADLLLLPELFLGGYLCFREMSQRAVSVYPLSKELSRVGEIAKECQVAICLGYTEVDDAGNFFNSCGLFDVDGKLIGNYRKTHLFGKREKAVFKSGDVLGEVFCVAGTKVSMLICYDIDFPEAVRKCVVNGATCILIPTANFKPYNCTYAFKIEFLN